MRRTSRPRNRPGSAAGALLALLVLVLPSGCERPPPDSAHGAPQPSAGAAAPATASVAAPDGAAAMFDLVVGPVTQFAQSCSRCHGAHGALYGAAFAALDEPALAAKIREMMEHNAQLRPTATDVAAMVAHHRALQRRRPFLCVTNGAAYAAGRETVLRGECAGVERVTAEVNGRAVPVAMDGDRFEVALGGASGVVLRAENSAGAVTLDFPRRQWTE